MRSDYDFYSRTNQCLVDALISGAAFCLAYLIRFELDIPPEPLFQMWLLLPAIVIGRVAVNWLSGIYFLVWRYVGVRDAGRIGAACLSFSLLLLVLRLAAPPSWQLVRVPLSIIVIEFLVTLTGALGARWLRRVLHEGADRGVREESPARRLLLLGAGRAGIMVAQEAKMRPGTEILGFLDDNPRKIGSVICGARVLGPLEDLHRVALEKSPDEVVICIAGGTRAAYRKILRLCDGLSIPTKVVPPVAEILEGKVGITSFRDVDVNDLLGRESVAAQGVDPAVKKFYGSRRILVAGAGGSIGSELVRQLAALRPQALVLLDKDENGLFELQKQLAAIPYEGDYQCAVGDLRSFEQLARLLHRHQPDFIFHAAAHKHVPMMEENASEAVFNNVFGTRNLFDLASRFGVEGVLFISSDKAVEPANIMGATKRVGELLALSQEGKTRFTCVRFGNVLDSRGSVIPVFREQIARGGPITITDPEMRRYFMTIPEAVHLILMAGQMDAERSLYVLDMGDPRAVVDLARDLVEIAGLRLGQDIQMVVTGTRPGEKLTETLCSPGERLEPSGCSHIMRVVSLPCTVASLTACLEKLQEAAAEGDEFQVRMAFRKVGISLPVPAAAPPALPVRPAAPLYQSR